VLIESQASHVCFGYVLEPHMQAAVCRAVLEKYLPGIDASRHDTYLRCLYTNVAARGPDGEPDRDFVVGHHPDDPQYDTTPPPPPLGVSGSFRH
jgi:hypothetical protein